VVVAANGSVTVRPAGVAQDLSQEKVPIRYLGT
jgi:hypothetical protein